MDGGSTPQLKTTKKHRRREKRGQRRESKSSMDDLDIKKIVFILWKLERTSTEVEIVQCDWESDWLKEFEVY